MKWFILICEWFIFDYSKDVRLPLQLQRAMAAEAEASREARAKVGIRQKVHSKTPIPSVTY